MKKQNPSLSERAHPFKPRKPWILKQTLQLFPVFFKPSFWHSHVFYVSFGTHVCNPDGWDVLHIGSGRSRPYMWKVTAQSVFVGVWCVQSLALGRGWINTMPPSPSFASELRDGGGENSNMASAVILQPWEEILLEGEAIQLLRAAAHIGVATIITQRGFLYKHSLKKQCGKGFERSIILPAKNTKQLN